MDPFSLAIMAVNALSGVLSNPALGGGSSVRLDQASELLGILGSLMQEGDEALDDLKDFTSLVEEMAAKGRSPTPGEWDVLRARSDDAHARLQAAKEELLADEEEEEDDVNDDDQTVDDTTDDDDTTESDPTPATDTLPDDDEPPVVDPNA